MTSTSVPASIAAMTPSELGRGLMRGDRSSLQLGYSAENAALAVIERHALDSSGWLQLRSELLGFAHGLLRLPTADAHQHLAARLPEALSDVDARAAHHSGHQSGLREPAERTYPAELDGHGEVIP
jgi:hypothetical protein